MALPPSTTADPESAAIDALSKRMDGLLRKMEEALARMSTTPSLSCPPLHPREHPRPQAWQMRPQARPRRRSPHRRPPLRPRRPPLQSRRRLLPALRRLLHLHLQLSPPLRRLHPRPLRRATLSASTHPHRRHPPPWLLYSWLLETYIRDGAEKDHLFRAIDTVPAVGRKAAEAMRWIDGSKRFAERLVALSHDEGLTATSPAYSTTSSAASWTSPASARSSPTPSTSSASSSATRSPSRSSA
ncbi:ribonucleoside-diphosphate reductase small chain C-like [Panicum miliaceum]|uniref:Ribonucleoside-diphosphate reductase small chain C-like n=1 Tax=Panicum miliaceum TaxID=4540 RepID=A0A3L6SYN0_PANMI|nr:ribonucleoside-diphosphate reductase small chain C-like [Panicum miliaceum]